MGRRRAVRRELASRHTADAGHAVARRGGGQEFPWEPSANLRCTPQGEFLYAFPPECPLGLQFVRITADHPVPPSFHRFLELALICAGRGRFTVAGRRYAVAAGDLLLVGNSELYHVAAAEGQSLEVARVYFLPELVCARDGRCWGAEYLAPYLSRSADFSHMIPRAGLPEHLVRERVGQIRRELTARDAGYRLAMKTYLADILLEANRPYRLTAGAAIPPDQPATDDKRLQAVLNFLQAHAVDPIDRQRLARMAHVSPNYLCRFFKAATGQTLTEYVWRMRMDLAAELLRNSQQSITQIAHAVGCSSHSHFDRLFKRLRGATPLKYRRARASGSP